jgi:hypothetical protein
MSQNEESLLIKIDYHYQIAVKPLESGSCLIKSIEINSQGWSRIESCWRRPYSLSCFSFDLAQVVQD